MCQIPLPHLYILLLYFQNRYETPSVWVVGLVIFLLVYFLLMGLGVWFYCKYCKGKRIVDQRSDQTKICSNDAIADQRAITYGGEID